MNKEDQYVHDKLKRTSDGLRKTAEDAMKIILESPVSNERKLEGIMNIVDILLK